MRAWATIILSLSVSLVGCQSNASWEVFGGKKFEWSSPVTIGQEYVFKREDAEVTLVPVLIHMDANYQGVVIAVRFQDQAEEEILCHFEKANDWRVHDFTIRDLALSVLIADANHVQFDIRKA